MALLVLGSLPADAQESKLMLVFVGSTCENLDYYHEKLSPDYVFTCVGSTGGNADNTFMPIIEIDYLWLRDFGYNVLFVVPEKGMIPTSHNGVEFSHGGGVAFPDEDYGYAWSAAFMIEHEAKHLKEERFCTSDGYHDNDYWCQID